MGDITREFTLALNAKDKASSVIKKVSDELEKAQSKIKKLNNVDFSKSLGSIGSMPTSVAAVGVAAVGASVAMGAFLKPIIDANDALTDMADRTGVTVENLSVLREVAKFGDVELETLGKAFNKLNVMISKSPEKLELFGVKVKNAKGETITADDAFGQLADKIKEIEDPADQAALALEYFGKQGLDLLPVLKQGSEGFKNAKKDAQDFGSVVSKSLSDASGAFNDNLQRFGMVAKGVGNNILSELLPGMNLISTAILDSFRGSEALKTNNKSLEQSISELSKSRGFVTLIGVIGMIGDGVQSLAELVGDASSRIFDIAQEIGSRFLLLKDITAAFLKGDKQAAADAYEAYRQSHEKIAESWNKTTGEQMVRGTSKFSDGLNQSLSSIVAKAEEAAKKVGDANTKTGTTADNLARTTIKSVSDQIKIVSTIADQAQDKAKKAIDNQKKVVEEFENLQKRLNKNILGGTLSSKLDQVKRDTNADNKIQELNDKKRADAKNQLASDELTNLQNAVEKRQQAYDADQSSINSSLLKEAQKKLANEKAWQDEKAAKAELNAIDETRLKKETSLTESAGTRSAVYGEMANIQRDIANNTEKGYTNEAEIKRLQDVGKVLEENKDKATGIFSTADLEQYGQKLKELASQATEADAKTAQEQADKALKTQLETFKQLQNDLGKIRIGVSDESVKETVDYLVKKIEEGLSSIKTNINASITTQVGDLVLPSLPEPIKKADGGYIHGAGTSRSDSIRAWLSTGEFVVSADRVRQPGALAMLEAFNNGGDFSPLRKPNYFADGGLVGLNTSNTNNVVVDLRTDNGNMKIGGNTTQNDINKYIKASLRR